MQMIIKCYYYEKFKHCSIKKLIKKTIEVRLLTLGLHIQKKVNGEGRHI